jgi:murein DD-endopeptidase MepM/ murein hydrolase activator NlpD
VVTIANWVNGYGNLVEIRHAGGIRTRYGHLSRLFVSRGANVAQGQLIAAIGSTGRSTGPHLHYEVRVNGVPTNPLNFIGQTGPSFDATNWKPEKVVAPRWTGWEALASTDRLPEAAFR